jgi:outer membrane protein assembly factor BamB
MEKGMHILKVIPLAALILLITACGGGGGGGTNNNGTNNSIPSTDNDGDGFANTIDAFPNDALEWLDTDKDGIGDNSDPDIDGDGTPNTQDAFPKDPLEQKDTDKDGIGDNSDPDIDGDGIANAQDLFPLDPLESLDTDKDGIGDNSDPDVDGDGTPNTQDAFPKDPLEQKDTDKDGIGDKADPDIDGDGILNAQDVFPQDPLEWLDTDSDGTGDNADKTPMGELMPAWQTFQGNAQHTGLVAETLDTANFKARWSKTLAGYAYGSSPPQGAAGDGYIFFTLENVLYALRTSTGETLWTKTLTVSNPPAYADGIVYVQASENNAIYLWAFNAADGHLIFKSPIEAQSSGEYAPAIIDNTIYLTGGYYGDMYAIDAKTGARKWLLELDIYNLFAPATTDDYSLIYTGSPAAQLTVINRKTGTVAFNIADPDFAYEWNVNVTTVASGDNVAAIQNRRLIHFNLKTKTMDWAVKSQFMGHPAIKEDKIYAINSGKIEVRNLATGALISTTNNTTNFMGNLLLTNNLLFVNDGINTYAYDTASLQKAWTLNNKSGAMFMADDALYVLSNLNITAIEVKADIDKDGLPDWWEKLFGKNIDPAKDQDNDGLTGAQEFANNTNPLIADTDGDGLLDGAEVTTHLTSPLSRDSDSDNLNDYDEVTTHKTNPNLADSDGDTLSDAAEVDVGLNPLDATDAEKDNDNDGFSNRHEVLASTNLNSATSIPQITDWGMLDGNSKHNSYQPLMLNAETFKLRWSASLPNAAAAAATGNDKIYLRTDSNIVSLNAGTGEFVWSYPFSGGGASFANNTVYAHVGGHGATAFLALNSETGALKFSSSHGSQWANYSAPTIYDGRAYINGGYYGGLVTFNAITGAKGWEISTPTVEWADYWEPAVNELGLFVVAQNKLRALSRVNGSVIFEIESPQPINVQTPIIGSKGNVLTRGAGITSYDIATRKVAWQTPNRSSPYSSIAVGNGQVYALSGNTITVFDETNGRSLWSWTRPNTNLTSNIVVTASHLFVADNSNTYAVDLSSQIMVWSYAKGGQKLSIGKEGALFVTSYSDVFAIEIEGDKDADGIPDWWERNYGGDLSASADADYDGLTNLEEFNANTNPLLQDTDGDTLSDSQEVKTLRTNPLSKDSDKDGLDDNIEISLDTNPLVVDTDGDGIDDQSEIQNSLDPNNANDANLDADNDGFSNQQEIFAGTSINNDADFPTVHDWGMTQGNAAHDGFQPLVLSTSDFSLRWRKSFSEYINPLSTGGDKLFVTSIVNSTAKLYALNPIDGSSIWTNDIDSTYLISGASFADNKVYALSRGYENSALWAFNANTGEELFRSNHNNSSPYDAPTLFDGKAYVGLGYSSGITAFDLTSGSKLWESDAGYSSNLAEPAVNTQSVFTPYNNKVNVINRQTGTQQFLIDTPVSANTLVLGKLNNMFVVSNNVRSINLTTYDTNWTSVQNNITGLPAVGNRSVYFISSGTLYSVNELTGNLQWSWAASNATISSNIIVTLSHVFVATNSKTYAIDVSTGLSTWSYDAGGKLSLGRDGALYIATSTELYAISITGDKDSDGIPDWWEEFYGLDPLSNADASQDLDSDGLNNLEEYELKSKPNLADSDGDTLSDYVEARTYHTSPILADTDGDGLSDKDEVSTHSTNPLVVDTDGDTFSDWDEILKYSTDPNSASSMPSAITTYSESFETTPLLWINPTGSNAAWVIDNTTASNGTQSLKSGAIGHNQRSDVEFSGLFATTVLSFDAKVSSESCCDYLNVYVDDVLVIQRVISDTWTSYSINLTQGEHKIRWSYIKDGSAVSGSDAAWIDNISIQ